MKKNKTLIFTIIALGHFGDTILVEPLCKNIRNNFPNSKIFFIANNVFKETPLGFDSIDEIYGYDKEKLHKGFLGCIKFGLNFPYRNKTDYAIITHPHERSILTAKLIGAKNIISLPVKRSPFNLFINIKRKRNYRELKTTFKGNFNSKYLTPICEYNTLPVRYIRKDINEAEIKEKFNLPDKYIVLSPTSKDIIKDWDYENIKTFILRNKYKTVLVGTEKAYRIAQKLKNEKICFFDLTKKTTITELGAIIKRSSVCISVDTGTFHFSYAQGVKTIGLFYSSRMQREWVPKDSEYISIIEGKRYRNNHKIICEKNINAEDVLEKVENILNAENKCMSFI